MRTFGLCALCALTLVGCSNAPTAPTRIDTAPQATQRMQAPTRNTGSLGPALGAGSATNHEGIAGWFVRIVFRLTADGQQIEVANTSQDAAPGQTVNLNVGIAQDDCESYQDDIFWLLPRATHYTLSDTMNYQPVASRVVSAAAHCRKSPPPCIGDCAPKLTCPPPVTIQFPPNSYIARFPLGFVNPWYPREIGPFPFIVPLADFGYRITGVTYDPHSVKQDGTQDGERGTYVFNNGWTLGPTDDIPDNADYAVTDFGVRGLISSISSVRFVHAVEGYPDTPTDSFEPVSLTFTCVQP